MKILYVFNEMYLMWPKKSRTVLNVTLVTIDEVYWLGTEVPRLLGLLFYYFIIILHFPICLFCCFLKKPA